MVNKEIKVTEYPKLERNITEYVCEVRNKYSPFNGPFIGS